MTFTGCLAGWSARRPRLVRGRWGVRGKRSRARARSRLRKVVRRGRPSRCPCFPPITAGLSERAGFIAPLTGLAIRPSSAIVPPTASAELWPTRRGPAAAVPKMTSSRAAVRMISVTSAVPEPRCGSGSRRSRRARCRGASAAYRLSTMTLDVIRVADRVAGDAIERLTSAHHARRLGKLGRSAQRTPPDDGRLCAAGDPPPRAGNAIDVLIEGAAYFPALEQAIRDARRSVLIAGWCITPEFALVRDEPPVLLRELLGRGG